MARLITAGAETGSCTGTLLTDPDGLGLGSSPVTCSSAAPGRTGAFYFTGNSGGANLSSYWQASILGFAFAASTSYYARAAIGIGNVPTSGDTKIMTIGDTNGCSIRYANDGTLKLYRDDTNAVLATSTGVWPLSTNIADGWNMLAMSVVLNASRQVTSAEMLLNGVVIGSASGTFGTIGTAEIPLRIGWLTGPRASLGIWFDDVAFNDSTGAAENGYPAHFGRIVLVEPTADSAGGTGWTLGTGTALGGNGFDAVNNQPPTGVADLAAGSNPKQVRNAANSANSNLDLTLQSYSGAGINQQSPIKVLVPIASTAAPVSTSAKQGTLGIVSNPTIANVALATSPGTSGAFWAGVAGGTWPTGWKWSRGTTTYNPTVTYDTAPVIRMTQVTGSTRIAVVSAMGLLVEYDPVPPRNPAINFQDPGLL